MNAISVPRGINRPAGKVDIPSAWLGKEMSVHPERWLVSLSASEIAELESAAEAYLGSGKEIAEITKESFPLPRLSAHLEELKSRLLTGLGFEVIRGLLVANYSQKFAATIFCGVGAHLGSARSQNAAGHILGHVRDIGADAGDPNVRIYQTSERQTFHTDSSDVVGLLCIREAMEGGDSLLVSTSTIYNKMFARRPDLAALLFEPIATDRRGEVPENEKPYLEIPVLNWHAGFLTGFYQRQYIDSAQRFPDAPRLTPDRIEALDLFDALANDPNLHVAMRLQPGDMQFVYNHALLHDRTGFRDWPDASQKRHLLRLWLSMEGDRPLPDCFRQRYGSIEIGNRGGIVVKGTRLNVPLD
ncbi:TauD/TfdA family dioxygenase [Bradyrhizobium sp. CCBAU 53340]|uniref:TauD/TfdA family dioxygenase n=1 Tax=Bradyrhizobium sp. CCBAU 53340 TaxID=1325112 RepID=UPI001889DE63|nr:TauD/TfdA family dioxygenase [Bradyrhizobium sp. CCBAU 53340]QOZ47212.1 TauD/TfdA family dioxygenase [Bradyrhizobium sp. CCBAU 53340]